MANTTQATREEINMTAAILGLINVWQHATICALLEHRCYTNTKIGVNRLQPWWLFWECTKAPVPDVNLALP